MKTLSIYLLIALSTIGLVACNSAPGSVTPDAYSSNYSPYLYGGGTLGGGTTTTTTTTLPDFTSGATAAFVVDGGSLAAQNQLFSQYTMRASNNPQNMQINVNLSKTYGGNGYGGSISLRYQDNGITYQGTFSASQVTPDSTKYNIWFNYGGKTVFHGFFEDNFGAVIIVFDGVYNLGDGSPAFNTSGGSLYFKNFGQTYAPHPPSHCWLVSTGPYDCRAWKWGDGVATTYAIYPESYYYTRLGTFQNMNLYQAFNTTSLP